MRLSWGDMKDGHVQDDETKRDQSTGLQSMSAGSQCFEPGADNTRDLRDAFACFGTGVTIVTAETDAGPVGMTANSFSSISLVPALVLWSPAIASKRHDAFVGSAHFCIHVLSERQLDMARHFASNGTDFEPFDWARGPHGAPTLPGCLAEFHCDTHAVHPAGDHSLVLGRVRTVVHAPSVEKGLLFEKGLFGAFKALPVSGQ